MSQPNGSTVTATAVSSLVCNLRLLDLDKCDDWPKISTQTFANKDSPQNQRARIQCVEWICYHLYQIWDPLECQEKLQPFYPPFEPLQSINLRAALFRCLSELKRDGVLGRDIYLRKSMFDECKGDTVLKVLVSFSTIVLRQVLASDTANRNSFVGRLMVAAKISQEDRTLLLPLAIAHRRLLSSLLKSKRILRARYRDLDNALANKDQDLAQKFEKIVETQGFLDQNPPSEDTVDRVSKVIEQQWQGNREFLEVIAQGEEQKISDVLLDNGFETIWQKANIGEFNGDISTTKRGLIEDLEKRTANQQARLEDWKDFKKSLNKGGTTNRVASKSPSKQRQSSPKRIQYEQRREKELVFSPRKSPRKSTWPEMGPEVNAKKRCGAVETDVPNSTTMLRLSPLAGKSKESIESAGAGTNLHNSLDEDHDDSSLFSRVSANDSDQPKAQFTSKLLKIPNIHGTYQGNTATITANTRPVTSTSEIGASVTTGGVHKPATLNGEDNSPFPKVHEDDQVAGRLISFALNATLTPTKKSVSLRDQTRDSMAVTSSDSNLPQTFLPSLVSYVPNSDEMSPTKTLPTATLAERTRKSISLVPARSKRSRDTAHIRRESKNFPTNQFETPERQGGIRKLTPPEELMSPRAGYDSVFKSRPKVALSPTTSPDPESRSSVRLQRFDTQTESVDE